MTFHFRPAVRERTSLLIGLIGSSGSGKSFSAQLLARGIAGPDGRIAVIDTEKKRMLHYADQFKFDHLDMDEPFSPEHYQKAIEAADEQGYDVVIVDSMSHSWIGVGGCHDIHDEFLNKHCGNDWKKRERMDPAAWNEAKYPLKRMMMSLMRRRAHLILCFRAEEKIKIWKDPGDGKTKIIPVGWQPICEKNVPYELTVSILLTDDAKGVPKPIKVPDQMQPFFPLDRQIAERSGAMLAQWAAGAQPPQAQEGKREPEAAAETPGDIAGSPKPWYWIGKDGKRVEFDNAADWGQWMALRLPKMTSKQISEMIGRMDEAFKEFRVLNDTAVSDMVGKLEESFLLAKEKETQ